MYHNPEYQKQTMVKILYTIMFSSHLRPMILIIDYSWEKYYFIAGVSSLFAGVSCDDCDGGVEDWRWSLSLS